MEPKKGLVVCEVLKVKDNLSLHLHNLLNVMYQVLFNLTVNSSQEDTQELVTIAAVLKDLVRVQTPDPETRLKIVSNSINVVANMEGWEVSSGKAVLLIMPTFIILRTP